MAGRFEEHDAKWEAEKRRAQIEYRTKKRYSGMFLAFCCLLQVVITLTLVIGIGILLLALAVKLFHLNGETGGNYASAFMIIILGGGMFGGFKIYKLLIRLIIRKRNLYSKLTNDILIHYFTEDELHAMEKAENEAAAKREAWKLKKEQESAEAMASQADDSEEDE